MVEKWFKFKQFGRYSPILQVSDEKISEPNDEYVEINILGDLLITFFVDPIKTVVTSTYLNYLQIYTNDVFEQLRLKLLSCLKIPGLPNHSIKLKIDTTIILIRNLYQ